MRAIAMMVVVAAAACGGGKDPDVCKREAHALGELLSTMDYAMPPFYVGTMELVLRTDVPKLPTERGRTIEVRPDGVTFEGRPIVSAAALAEARELATARGWDDGDFVYVAVDAKATWDRVGGALRFAHEVGYRRVGLAFQRPASPVTKPPRSPIDDDLDRLQADEEASNKATQLAKMVEKLVKGCPAIVEVFGSVAADDGTSKADTIVRAIEPSLVKCNCNVNMPAFRSIMFRVLYIEKPQSAFEITLDPNAPPLTLPSETLWRDANAKLTPGARVWIPAS